MRTMISSVIIVIAAVIGFFHGSRNKSGYGWRNTVCDDCRFFLYDPGY